MLKKWRRSCIFGTSCWRLLVAGCWLLAWLCRLQQFFFAKTCLIYWLFLVRLAVCCKLLHSLWFYCFFTFTLKYLASLFRFGHFFAIDNNNSDFINNTSNNTTATATTSSRTHWSPKRTNNNKSFIYLLFSFAPLFCFFLFSLFKIKLQQLFYIWICRLLFLLLFASTISVFFFFLLKLALQAHLYKNKDFCWENKSVYFHGKQKLHLTTTGHTRRWLNERTYTHTHIHTHIHKKERLNIVSYWGFVVFFCRHACSVCNFYIFYFSFAHAWK